MLGPIRSSRVVRACNSRRLARRQPRSTRQLGLQQLESRQLLAVVGDWAVIDLQAHLADETAAFQDLSGVTFVGGQVAVSANVLPTSGGVAARLLAVDVDLDTHTASLAGEQIIPSLSTGGTTEALAVNSNGTSVFVTGYSISDDAPEYGEAFRAIWDGSTLVNTGLGFIAGKNSPNPVSGSVGITVNSQGIVAGSSDAGRAIFEYDQQMVHAGDLLGNGLIYGISDDRVKAGFDGTAVVWLADNTTRVEMNDPYGDGVFTFGISPDSSRVVGSVLVFGVGGSSIEKMIWWSLDGTAHQITSGDGQPVDGRLTGATNGDVGYHVGQANPTGQGDWLHMESTNTTVRIVDWFESLSGLNIPSEASLRGPRIAYDAATGQVAIVSGGHLFVAKINEPNVAPTAVADQYLVPMDQPFTVAAPGVLINDTDDGLGTPQVILVTGPSHGSLNLQSDGGFTYTPTTGFNLDDSFTYKVNDGELDSAVVRVDLNMDTLYPWHNGLRPLDVNLSGHVSPLDALTVINALNAGVRGWLPVPRPRPLIAPFYDTNSDKAITPLDALLVINYLNRNQTGGEGESDSGIFSALFASGGANDEMNGSLSLGSLVASRESIMPSDTTDSGESVDSASYDIGLMTGNADGGPQLADEVWRSAEDDDDEDSTWSDLLTATWFATESEAD